MQVVRNRFFIVVLVGITVIFGNTVLADENETPVVLILSIASTPETAQLEQGISSEIALTLTHFKVVTLRENLTYFADATAANRMEILKKISAANNAVAIVWIESGPSGILLHLVALNKDQDIVRIVESSEVPTASGELGLIVHEWLKQSDLFEDPSVSRPNGDTAPQTAVDSSAPVHNPNNDESSHHSKWSLVFSAGMGGPLVSHKGSSQGFIGMIALERALQNRWYLFPEVRFLMIPEQNTGDSSQGSIGGAIGFGAGYHLQFQRFILSPELSIRGVLQKIDVVFEDNITSSFRVLNGNLGFTLRFQWAISNAIFLGLFPGVAFNIVQTYIHRTSNDAVVYASPRVEWQVLGALGIKF